MSDDLDWIHRDRGILTERDREILTGKAGAAISQNALNQRYYNIRTASGTAYSISKSSPAICL